LTVPIGPSVPDRDNGKKTKRAFFLANDIKCCIIVFVVKMMVSMDNEHKTRHKENQGKKNIFIPKIFSSSLRTIEIMRYSMGRCGLSLHRLVF